MPRLAKTSEHNSGLRLRVATASGSDSPRGFVPARIDTTLAKKLAGLPIETVHEIIEYSNATNFEPGELPGPWLDGPAAVSQCFLSEDTPAGATTVKLNFVTRGPPGHVQSLHGRRLRLQFASAWTPQSISAWDDEFDAMNLNSHERSACSTWTETLCTRRRPFNFEAVEVCDRHGRSQRPILSCLASLCVSEASMPKMAPLTTVAMDAPVLADAGDDRHIRLSRAHTCPPAAVPPPEVRAGAAGCTDEERSQCGSHVSGLPIW